MKGKVRNVELDSGTNLLFMIPWIDILFETILPC